MFAKLAVQIDIVVSFVLDAKASVLGCASIESERGCYRTAGMFAKPAVRIDIVVSFVLGAKANVLGCASDASKRG
jgi:hypothetical protein